MSCKKSFNNWVEKKELLWANLDKRRMPRPGAIKHFTPLDKIKFYHVWHVAWVLGRQRLLKEIKDQNRNPIPDDELKQMWISSGLGKDFGRAVERRHGIK